MININPLTFLIQTVDTFSFWIIFPTDIAVSNVITIINIAITKAVRTKMKNALKNPPEVNAVMINQINNGAVHPAAAAP